MTNTTNSDREMWDRLGPWLIPALADGLKPHIDGLQRQIHELQADTLSLRRQLSTAAGAGVRRRFTGEVIEDPDHPGCSLLFLDDGSALALPDQRLTALAGVHPAGRA
jgi:hypothetical protein